MPFTTVQCLISLRFNLSCHSVWKLSDSAVCLAPTFSVNQTKLKTQWHYSTHSEELCVYLVPTMTAGVNQNYFCPVYKDNFVLFQVLRMWDEVWEALNRVSRLMSTKPNQTSRKHQTNTFSQVWRMPGRKEKAGFLQRCLFEGFDWRLKVLEVLGCQGNVLLHVIPPEALEKKTDSNM